jgi:hypothetical protein
VRRADNLVSFMCRLSGNFGSPKNLEPQGPLQACTDIALAFALVMLHCVNQKMAFEKGAGFIVATYPLYSDTLILSLCVK